MRQTSRRRHVADRRAPRLARAALLGATTLTLTVGFAATANAAEESDEEEIVEDDEGNPGPVAAAVVGLLLGGAGFALSEAGEGPYPEEHH